VSRLYDEQGLLTPLGSGLDDALQRTLGGLIAITVREGASIPEVGFMIHCAAATAIAKHTVNSFGERVPKDLREFMKELGIRVPNGAAPPETPGGAAPPSPSANATDEVHHL